jgi:hypothetical protein
MTKTPQVADIAAALSGRGRHGHSALYWWIWDHYDELAKHRQGRADWISATEGFAGLGLTNKDGSPLKRENVRKTWERVVRDVRKAAAVSPPSPMPPPVRPIQPAVTPVVQTSREGTADERRRTSRFHRWNPATTDEDYQRLTGKPKPK